MFLVGERVVSKFMGEGTVKSAILPREDKTEPIMQEIEFDNPLIGTRAYPISKLRELNDAVD